MPQSIPGHGLEADGGILNGYPYNRMRMRQRIMADHLSTDLVADTPIEAVKYNFFVFHQC